jgi:O-antigen/teichoic acid export membrane protein
VSPSRSQRFFRNLRWNILGQFAGVALNFFVVPLLIGKLGKDAYGLYLLLHAPSIHLMILALGSGSAAVKYASELRADGDADGFKRLVRFTGLMHLAGPALGAMTLFISARFAATHVYGLDPQHLDAGVFVLRCGAVGAIAGALVNGCLSVLQGLQRFGASNFISFLHGAVIPVIAAVAASMGLGIETIGWGFPLGLFLVLLPALWVTRRAVGELPDGPPSPIPLRDFVVWGISGWLGQVSWIVSNQFDKILITNALSLTALTLYSVPAGMLSRLQTLPASAALVLLPIIAELKGETATADLRRIYLKATRLLLWLVMPVLTTLFVLMPQFLGVWVGGDFSDSSVWPARLLIIAQVFTTLSMTPTIASFGTRHPWYSPALAWSQALLSAALWYPLVPRLGILGAATGTLVGQALPTLVVIFFVHRRLLKLRLVDYLREGVVPPLASAVAAAAAIFPFHGRATTWPLLFVFGGAACAVYAACTWLLMGADDRRLAREQAGKLAAYTGMS